MIRVEMLSTGDEVLHGQIIDTNAAWLADYLFNQGLPISRRETVGDSLSALIDVLTERSQVADILIVNGGLGPTSDDLSALAAARAAGVELIEHPEWIARMEAFFHARNRVMSAANRKQAYIPASAEMLDNPVGTACGFALRFNKCLMFFTPGVPSEFKVMVEQQIMPRLRQYFEVADPPLCLRMTTFGRSESDLAQELDRLKLPEGTVLGYRSSAPIIELKLTGPALQHQAMEQVWQQMREVAGDNTIFEGTQGLPALLAEQLTRRGLLLAVSEQFTGGLMNWQLQNANVPLVGGELLPVHCQESLAKIASRAQSLSMLCGAQVVLAVSAMQNDYLSVALHTPEGIFAQTLRYQANRHDLRIRQESSAMLALDMLRRWLKGSPVCGQHGWLEVVKIL
ncbi:MAG: hypothetical protein RLY17_1425 [Pseudomonadota bacterium]|jgi:competence/damage-inducible protein CinA-like protein